MSYISRSPIQPCVANLMSKAMIIESSEPGATMVWREHPVAKPTGSQILIRQNTIGVNYIDLHHTRGEMGSEKRPLIPGVEGAGVIEALGEGCRFGFEVGERVCYAGGPVGAYAQMRLIDERHLVKIPDAIDDVTAAACMVKGLTAHMLLKRVFFADDKATMLVHAAAGGVGQLLCQWGKILGARVIGTVGSEAKAQQAKAIGCDAAILYQQEDIVERVKELTEGRGCNVVYDSIGRATFDASLASLMPFGMLVSYGEASGPVPPLELSRLQRQGSVFLTRPSLEHYLRDHTEYLFACSELLRLVNDGALQVPIGQTYYLWDAARAHDDLQHRRTIGSTILYPYALD